MCCKLKNVILFVIFSFFSIGQAHANFIVGDVYSDTNSATSGVFWEFVGSYDLADAPSFVEQPDLLNGIDTANLLYGELLNGEYALSTDEENLTVNHSANYSFFDDGITPLSESYFVTDFGDIGYSESGDVSAYVNDSTNTFDFSDFSDFAGLGDFSGFASHINYVFRSIEVPEPSTIVFLGLILFIFSNRYLKKQ